MKFKVENVFRENVETDCGLKDVLMKSLVQYQHVTAIMYRIIAVRLEYFVIL